MPFAWKPFSVEPASFSGGAISLHFEMEDQQDDNWCWAAVAVSIGKYFEPATLWTQCKLVNFILSRSDCCGDPIPCQCDKARALSPAIKAVGNLHNHQSGYLKIEDARLELEDGNPVGMALKLSFSTHFVVLHGIQWGSQELMFIKDPDMTVIPLQYGQFPGGPYGATAKWIHTYRTEA